jgi:hypothetical protein
MIGSGPVAIIVTMHKHIITTLMVVGALTLAHPFEAVSQDVVARAASVIADARKALGGGEKISAVKTLQATGDIRRSMGEMQMEGELELLIEAPDKLRRNESIGIPGGALMIRTEVLNGTDVWDDSSQRGGMGGGHVTMMMRGPGGNMDEAAMKDMRRRMRRADLARLLAALLLASDTPMTHAGVAEAPDGKADILEIKPADAPVMRLFIDQQTHMPLMLTWKGPQPRIMVRRGQRPPNPDPPAREGQAPGENAEPLPEANYEMRFDDYRTVDGLQLPHQITRSMNGQTNEEFMVKTYKVNPAFKSNTFTK